ncbi:helix-turn-helix domain-containing protein [Microbacterium sp. LWS13-1.2]|uniref:TetR/AcrR family transcriptional regulator n=1 Tax=Microbacterium sp. LWS13-1.2 TaxID=3135264 RepID=A0AAU6S8M8_9MICO
MATRGPYAKGTAKRAEILEAALEAVAQHGTRRTYVSEIAERVGLTQTGLMHHFRSREELYEEVIRARDEHDRATYADAPTGIEGFFAVIEHNQEVPGLVQLYVEFSAEATHSEHPSHHFFLERYASLRTALERDVALARESGDMGGNVDPTAVADLLIAAADGLQVQWLLDRSVDMGGRLRALWSSLCLASWADHA